MSISANTLFHFTKNAVNLIGILENGFYPRFCLEEKITSIDFDMAIPMVCFCDIPLSEVSAHISFYGNYGLGMKKEWALKNGINPVIYLSPDSSLAKYFDNIMSTSINVARMLEKGKLDKSDVIKISGFKDVVEVKAFSKPINGKMFKEGKFIERYFYDEREWRYVSFLNKQGQDIRLSKEEFLDPVKLAQTNSELSKDNKLSFDIDDIKYLIIDKESEIGSMINSLRKIFKNENTDRIEILCSKIITSKQINEDF